MSELLRFAEDTLQVVALIFMGTVYILKLRWYLKFKAGKERQAPTKNEKFNHAKGVVYSWANIAMPWAMESTRKKFFLYVQFVIFHIGVTASIVLSFVIPYAPQWLEKFPLLVRVFQVPIAGAFFVGLYRIYRRFHDKIMRAISTPDDYFSLILLTVWFAFAFFAAPNNYQEGETILLIYFFMTAFFLVYVPFSKISHYLYYPFTRYYFGKSMGHRGVYPLKRSVKPNRRVTAS